MVKNEENILEKTLQALVPLMKLIDSELIILDTGSTDNSVEIARRYTDKIYFKVWNNNFSDMRNESIKYASGKWIFVLDADEELMEYNKLVEFFNSDINDEYNSASIELKSMLSEDGKQFNCAKLPRIFRNTIDFRYEGAIHEQPIYKEPIFNRIATFNHYGYLFVDEELRQRKSKRNKGILFKALKDDCNNPYLNYQLGKDFIVSNEIYDGLDYLEKSRRLYLKQNMIPTFVLQDIARVYLHLNKNTKCKNLCLEYIKKDNKNIDIYFYLASSQMKLGEYEKSIESYNRYLYLIENYDITTQANNISCTGDTIACIQECKENMVICYFNLEKYSDVINSIQKLSSEAISNLYYVIFMSFNKNNKVKNIKEIYDRYATTNVEKIKMIENIEMMLNNIKINEKEKNYRILSEIEGNYGKLNKVRLGKKLTVEEYKDILITEKGSYYGDIIYYSLEENIDIEELLQKVSYSTIQNYISYIVLNRKESILKLYEILLNAPITLEKSSLILYSSLAKILLFAGNLTSYKYKNLFLMYMTYRYEYIRQIYREEFSDEELMHLVTDAESIFILEFMNIQNLVEINPLEYIRRIKKLLVENPQYKKGIQIFIDKFENEFNEKEELKKLKKQYKVIIEQNINKGNLDVSEKLINDYEDMFDYEDTNNIKAVVSMYRNNIEDTEKYLKLAYCNNRNDEDVLFNIAYIKENNGDVKSALDFYNKILNVAKDNNLKCEVLERIKNLSEEKVYI